MYSQILLHYQLHLKSLGRLNVVIFNYTPHVSRGSKVIPREPEESYTAASQSYGSEVKPKRCPRAWTTGVDH